MSQFSRVVERNNVEGTYQDKENESFGAKMIKQFMEKYEDDYEYFAYLSGESDSDPDFLHNVEHLLTIDPNSLPKIIGDALTARDKSGIRVKDEVLANIDRVVSTLCETININKSYWNVTQLESIKKILSGMNINDNNTDYAMQDVSGITIANLFKDQTERGTLPEIMYGFSDMDLNRSHEIHSGTMYSIHKNGLSGFMCDMNSGRYVIVNIYQVVERPEMLNINMIALLSKALYGVAQNSRSESEKLCILEGAKNGKNELMMTDEVKMKNGENVHFIPIKRTERFKMEDGSFGYLQLLGGDNVNISASRIGFDETPEKLQEKVNNFKTVAEDYIPNLEKSLLYGHVGESEISALNIFDKNVGFQRAYPKSRIKGLNDIPSILFTDNKYACTLNPMTYMSQLHLVFWPLEKSKMLDREYFSEIVESWLEWLVVGNSPMAPIVKEIGESIRIAKDSNNLVHVLLGKFTNYALQFIANADDGDDAVFKECVLKNDDGDDDTSGDEEEELTDDSEAFGPIGESGSDTDGVYDDSDVE